MRALCRACAAARHELAVLNVSGHALGSRQGECARRLAPTFTGLQKLKLFEEAAYYTVQDKHDKSTQRKAVVDRDAYFDAVEAAWGCMPTLDEYGFHQRDGAEQRMAAQRTLEGCAFEML
jgi:hypothetical protein